MIDRPRAHQRLSGPKELLHLHEVAVAQDRLQRRDPGIGAQYEHAVIARLLGQLAGINLEGLLGGRAQIPAVGGVADQRLVAPLQLLIERRNDGLAVGGVLLRLSFVAADDVAPPFSLNVLDEELGLLTAGAPEPPPLKPARGLKSSNDGQARLARAFPLAGIIKSLDHRSAPGLSSCASTAGDKGIGASVPHTVGLKSVFNLKTDFDALVNVMQ